MIALAFVEQIELHKTNLDRVKLMKRDFPCVHFSPSREPAHVRFLNATRPFFLMRRYMSLSGQPRKSLLVPEQGPPKRQVPTLLEVPPHHQAILEVWKDQSVIE